MASELIFLTGATGFIGAATVQKALQAGYKLRLSVRKQEQIDKLKSVFPEYTDKLDFVIVPDITTPGAFSKVLDGVDYVLHIASPLAGSTKKDQVITPAVNGTLAILRDAAKVPSIKKVVITSSTAALYPITGPPNDGIIREPELTGWDLSFDANQEFDENDPSTSFALYSASKLLANAATWEFVKEEKPSFKVVTLHPAMVYGHSLLQESAEGLSGTNGFFFGGIASGQAPDFALSSVYVGDVAEAHIRSLDPKIDRNTSYFLIGEKYTWKDVVEQLQRDYPNFPIKIAPNADPKISKTDTTKAETELGIKWTKPEKIIKDVFDQQLGFRGLL